MMVVLGQHNFLSNRQIFFKLQTIFQNNVYNQLACFKSARIFQLDKHFSNQRIFLGS